MAASSDTSPVERMERLLTCTMCKDALKEPRTLVCFHSFCKSCLTRFIEVQREEAQKERRAQHLFNCPTCRTQFQLGQDESVERLPSHYFINDMLDISKIQQEARKLPCESCKGQVSAECRCTGCERYLCKNCLTTHNNWPDFKDHVVLTLEELAKPENHSKARAKPCCQKHGHENRSLGFYCNTCHELACINCVVGLDHPKPKHDYQPVDVVAEQQKIALNRTSDILQKKSNEGQTALKKIKDAAQLLEANAKKATDAILKQNEEILNEFTRQLEVQTKVLLGEVDENYRRVHERFNQTQKIMKAYVEKVNGPLDLAKNIVEKGNNEDILSLGKEIILNTKDIAGKECSRLMPSAGSIDYQPKSTKTIFDRINLNDLGNVAAWEQRVDNHGRVYYVDHVSQTTTWKRPQTLLANKD